MAEIRRITIFYFSGTGNSKRIASWFCEFAVKKDIQCQLIDISKIDDSVFDIIDSNTLIGIISPVHGFSFPKITLDFIRNFPKGKNRIILMNTRGGMKIGNHVTQGLTGIAFMLSSFILVQKGYKIIGQIPFDMPSNWISIHPALNEKTVLFLHKKNYERVKKHSDKILSGKKDFAAYRNIIQDILISPVSLAYYFAGRFFFAKSYYASNDCDNCGLCIKQCPVKAIEDTGNRPFWTFKCESCMKCMSICPKKAIETTHGLWLVAGILCSTTVSVLLYKVLPINIDSALLKIALFSFIYIILIGVAYKIQHFLLKYKLIGKLISYTSLTHYKFWGRYKSVRDDKWK